MKYAKTSALIAGAALVLVPGTARVSAQSQAEQFSSTWSLYR